jgi:hypothetical protein
VTRHAAQVVWVVAIAAAVWLFVTRVSGKMPDLDVYLRAGARAAAAEPLYRVEDSHYQFKYLPAFALLMAPLGAASVPVARAVWFAISTALLAMLVLASVRLVNEPGRGRQTAMPPWLLGAIVVAVLGKFYARELVLGQVNAISAAVVVFALLAIRQGREAAAGALVALAIVLKPYFVLLVPWLLARRREGSIRAVALGLIIALLAPAVVYGVAGSVDQHLAWWHTVVSTTAPNVLNPDNVSWLAMFTRWFGVDSGPWPLVFLAISVVAALALLACVWAFREGLAFPEGLEGALLLMLMPFLSPQGWDYVLLVATPAVAYVVAYRDRLPKGLVWLTVAALAVVGVTIYDLMGRAAYHAFMNASGITLCFMVVIAAVTTLRHRGVA